MDKFTAGPWYYKASAGNHQGLVISEKTGATVALTYDTQDGPLVASAPDLARGRHLVQSVTSATIHYGEVHVDGRTIPDPETVSDVKIAA